MFKLCTVVVLPVTSKYIKLSEITEEEASDIVCDYNGFGLTIYRDYKSSQAKEVYTDALSAIQSLNSLLESHNIEINKNTFIFKK